MSYRISNQMIKWQMKCYVLFIVMLIPITACKQELNNIPDTGWKIVINGLITTDSLLNVHIGTSAYINGNFLGNNYNDQDSADVQFYLNSTLIDSLYHSPFYNFTVQEVFNQGNYRSKSVFPQPGKQYKVEVKAPDLPEASATAIIPELVRIIKADTSTIIMSDGSMGVMCKIEFNDPVSATNYYMLNIREMITKDYYVGIYNNLGFSCDDPIVEEKLYSGYETEGIAFSDKLINGQKHILTVIIKRELIGAHTNRDKQTVCYRLYSITEEYFSYIHDLNLYNKELGNPLDEPVMINSNVTGGYGMFSGAAVSSYSIVFKKL